MENPMITSRFPVDSLADLEVGLPTHFERFAALPAQHFIKKNTVDFPFSEYVNDHLL